MRETKERGAVVVEAVISMTAFMFAILIILSITDIAYTQSKMAVALNSAAKEISQYCFLYYKFQLDDVNANLSKGTEKAEATINETVVGLGQMMDSFGEAGSDFGEGNFESAFHQLESSATSANKTVSALANTIAEDPRGFLVGMGKLAGRELAEATKVYLGQVMAKAFMAKNLRASADDAPEDFLRRMHVVDGLDGLDFQYTSLMAYGASNEINLTCTYQIRVIRLLNMDFTFTFRQTARTLAWGGGKSLVRQETVWGMGQLARGQYIVGEEKQGYAYTSDRNGYHAFVNSAGKNEFVRIRTVDPTNDTYQDAGKLADSLSADFSSMYDGVSGLGSEITVRQNGEKKTVTSDPDSRTYKMVIVLPENTGSEDRRRVDQAIAQLKEKYPNETINVEVKEGYGALPETDSAESREEE